MANKSHRLLTLERAVAKYGFDTKRQKQGPIERIDNDYWYQGIAYPRITNILQVINMEGLKWWYAHEAAKAALKFRGKTSASAVGEVLKKFREAGNQGTDIHNWIRFHLLGIKISPRGMADVAQLKIQRYLEYKKREHFKIKLVERFAVSKKYGYGCMIDGLFKDRDGALVLQDYKSGNGIHWHGALQLTAQAQALKETRGITVDRKELLWITTDFCVPIPVDEPLRYVVEAKDLWLRWKGFKLK